MKCDLIVNKTKQGISLCVPVIYGLLRILVFLLTTFALLSLHLEYDDEQDYMATGMSVGNGNDSATNGTNGMNDEFRGILTICVIFRRVFETVFCIMVMWDAVVAYDIYGQPVKDSYLNLLKVPISISRGTLWLIVLSLPVTHAQIFLLDNYKMSVATMAIFVLNSSRKALVIPVGLYIAGSTIMSLCKNRTSGNDNDDLRSAHHSRPRHRNIIEKLVISLLCLVACVGHVLNIILSLQGIIRSQIVSQSGVFDTSSSNFYFGNSYGFYEQVQVSDQTVRNVIYMMDLVGSSLVRFLLTSAIVLYLLWSAVRDKYSPAPCTIKVVSVYLLLSSTPHVVVFITFKDVAVFLYILSTVLLIYIVVLLILSPPRMKDLSKLRNCKPRWTHGFRVLQGLGIIVGAVGLILLVTCIHLPWLRFDFSMKQRFKESFIYGTNMYNDINDVVNDSSDFTEAYKGNDEIINRIGSIQQTSECFNNSAKLGEYCADVVTIVGLYKNGTHFATDEANTLLTETAISMLKYHTDIDTAKDILETAQLERTFLMLRDYVFDLKTKFRILKEKLEFIRQFFKNPVASYIYTFRIEIHVLMFIFPSVIVGFLCVNLGFWRRVNVEHLWEKSYVPAFLFLSNTVCLVMILTSVGIIERHFKDLPLIKVDARKLFGWNVFTISQLCSASASGIMWLMSYVASKQRKVDEQISIDGDLSFDEMTGGHSDSAGGAVLDDYRLQEVSSTRRNNIYDGECIEEETSLKAAQTSPERNDFVTVDANVNSKATDVNEDSSTRRTNMDDGEELEEKCPKTPGNNDLETVDANTVSKATGENGDITSTRVWFMAMLPVSLALLALLLLRNQPSVAYAVHVNITKEIGATVDMIIEYSFQSSESREYVMRILFKNDNTTRIVRPYYEQLTSVLTHLDSRIRAYTNGLHDDFLSKFKDSITMTYSAPWLIYVPLVLAVLMFLFGIACTMMPIRKETKKRRLHLFLFLIWSCIAITAQLLFVHGDLVASIFQRVPMLEIKVETGPLIQYILACLFFLFFGFIELLVGVYMPVVQGGKLPS